MERILQEQIKLESTGRRSNEHRMGIYVQGIDCWLVSDTIPAFWEENTEINEGPPSQSRYSGRESIWLPLE